MNLIADIISVFVVVPFFSLLFFFLILAKVVKTKRKAFLLATDITNLFLMYSVYILIQVIWGYSTGLWIVGLYIIILGITGIIFWRISETIDFKKSFRVTWRFHFLLYCATYVCLLLYGTIDRVITVFY